MDYKTQSILTVSVLLVMMIVIGFSIGSIEQSITGASVSTACECIQDSDCNDNNASTQDKCVDKEDCMKAYCENK